MRSITIKLLAFSYLMIGMFSCSQLEAQEFKKFLRDYRDERIYNYTPTDPNFRGKVFRVHTKHYGAFYNCDGEENKRNSPYICWKPHHERVFPPRLGFKENLRRDIAEITQRINDGGCGTCAQGCDCAECQQVAPAVESTCSCIDCVAKANGLNQGQIYSSVQPGTQNQMAPRIAQQSNVNSAEPNGRHGLVAGKILGNESAAWQNQQSAVAANTSASARTNVANQAAPNDALRHAHLQQEHLRQAQIKNRNKMDAWKVWKR